MAEEYHRIVISYWLSRVSKKKPSYRNNRPKWLKGSIKDKTILEALTKLSFKDAPEGDGSLPRIFLKRGNSPHTNHHKTNCERSGKKDGISTERSRTSRLCAGRHSLKSGQRAQSDQGSAPPSFCCKCYKTCNYDMPASDGLQDIRALHPLPR